MDTVSVNLEPMRVPSGKKRKNKPDADTMDDNTSLRVAQKACVLHYQLLLQ